MIVSKQKIFVKNGTRKEPNLGRFFFKMKYILHLNYTSVIYFMFLWNFVHVADETIQINPKLKLLSMKKTLYTYKP